MRIFKQITTCVLLLVTLAAFEAGARPLRVLAIGNSFSVDAVNQNLWELGEADSVTFVIGNLYIGGCPLEKHWKNAEGDLPAYTFYKISRSGKMTVRHDFTLSSALSDEKWDVVVFQQKSGLSGIPESYEPYLGDLYGYVRERVPEGCRFMFHQTWAYSVDATHPDFINYDRSCGKMYRSIMSASSAACEKYAFGVIPSGTAIQNVRLSDARENVTRDGYHLNGPIGRYTAACTWFEALTGRNVVGNSYAPAHTEPWMKQICQEAAHAAVQRPFGTSSVGPRPAPPITDESSVPAFTLPDPLIKNDGSPVRDAAGWMDCRRGEILDFYRDNVYGRSPLPPEDLHFRLVESSPEALGGKATRKQVNLFLGGDGKHCLHLLIYLPNGTDGPVPVFMGINFSGNWGVSSDPAIIMPDRAQRSRYCILENNDQRGYASRRWPLEQIISAGYGVVTFYRGDVDPDFFDGGRNGIAPLIYREGQDYPDPDQWGTISQWAWSLSRALDYVAMDEAIDESRVAVIGHSRLGKAALWAAAQDPRFALAISNCSGAGGAALFHRCFGETVENLNHHFPHWFCLNFHKYDGLDGELPFDQHFLAALIAPRPLYIASADGDSWADPKGEFLCALEASKVYEFLGVQGLATGQWPEAEQPSIEGNVAYHMRHGKHDILAYDWTNYILFADKYLKK